MRRRLMLLLTVGVLAACDNYPRDPLLSLQEARQQGLRVGVANAPPWADLEDGRATGKEVDLIREFADSIGSHAQWVEGNEEELMRILENRELHLVIGGLTADTPWKKHVGLTNVYLKEDIVYCSTESDVVPRSVKGVPVGVKKGSATVADVKKKGGIPVPLDALTDYTGLIALSEQNVHQAGCRSATNRLATRKHVIAVPKGENALLMALEEYLNAAGY